MKLSRSQLSKIISSQTIEHGVSKQLGQQIAKILLRTKQTGSLDSIMRNVVNSWADHGYVDVLAHSAYPLSSKVKLDINKIIKKYYPHAKQIKIIEDINPDLIAGLVLEFADKQLDLSVETKLNKFKHFSSSPRKV